MALVSKNPKRSLLTFRLSIIASMTRSDSFTASPLHQQVSLNLTTGVSQGGGGGWTYASVVVVIFAMIPFVNPSISSGLAFFATLANNFEMIFSPFL